MVETNNEKSDTYKNDPVPKNDQLCTRTDELELIIAIIVTAFEAMEQ